MKRLSPSLLVLSLLFVGAMSAAALAVESERAPQQAPVDTSIGLKPLHPDLEKLAAEDRPILRDRGAGSVLRNDVPPIPRLDEEALEIARRNRPPKKESR